MKILVIQNRMGIGDMIMFLPFIKAISNHYGEQVSLMVKKSTKASEYLNEEKYIKEIIYLLTLLLQLALCQITIMKLMLQ